MNKITRASVMHEFTHVIKFNNAKGHDVKLYSLFAYMTPTFVINSDSRNRSHNLYVYVVNQGEIAICLGYRPVGDITVSDAIVNKYAERYRSITDRYITKVNELKTKNGNKLLIEKSTRQAVKRLLPSLVRDCILSANF